MASKKLRAQNVVDDDNAEMDMSPMIDLVFLLLIFFIVVSTPMIVQMDPEVQPSVAYNAVPVDEKNGRIVINVREDGTFTREKYKEGVMTEPSEITEYVKEQVEKIKALNYEPKIHIRGDDDALFKHSQTVMKAAAEGGVTKMIFSVYNATKKEK